MPERRWVIDASPLILLGKIQQMDLLPQLTWSLRIPPGVLQEIEQGLREDPARRRFQSRLHGGYR